MIILDNYSTEICAKKTWDDQLNPDVKRHLYIEDFLIEYQIPDEYYDTCMKVWDDIHNNHKLIFNNFDDYFIENFKKN